MGGAERQDQRAESFRELFEKIPSHPGGQRLERGLEGQICTLLVGWMSEQFLLISGPEEVGEVTF